MGEPDRNDQQKQREGGDPACPAPSPGPPQKGSLSGMLRDLWLGVRLALFLPVAPERFCATPGTLTLLALADFGFNVAMSLLLLSGDGSFNYSGLPAFYFHLPLMLLFGYLAARLLRRPQLLTLLPVAFVSLSIPIELFHGAIEWLMAHLPRLHVAWMEEHLRATDYYRFFWWWCAAAVVYLFRLKPVRAARRAGLVFLFLVALLAPLWTFPRGDLWIGGGENGESGELHLTEEVLAAQSHLLEDQLERLLPGSQRQQHLYFIGFAGDGSQDVFVKELSSMEKLFATRFGSAGRTVTLANNPRTATTLPFASATNLGQAIMGVAAVMNPEQDVLVVYLTSHGSREHELTVSNGPLELTPITPERVRAMLDQSGVTWKVLVVSACFAGGFIEPLKDDHTLIITAADATHESFGCGFGERFTWFGQAFNDALGSNYSFVTAFERARETIGRWEERQGETPSNPQIWIGKQIAGKLERLDRELSRPKRPDGKPR